ncbi:MAG: antibiotic biosynthesis monooxygenase [Halolamina sp.]
MSGEIVRVWHGWTAPEDADAYERCLVDGEAGLVETLNVEGYLGDELLRRDDGDEVEFVTLLRFEEYDAVAEFAGEDYERAHVPDATRELLSRWEDEATHYRHRASAKK